jgi:hypothetical protein
MRSYSEKFIDELGLADMMEKMLKKLSWKRNLMFMES